MRAFTRNGPNNLFHLILCLVTVGLWIPIWLLFCFANAFVPSRCKFCGGSRTLNIPFGKVFIFIIIAFLALGYFVNKKNYKAPEIAKIVPTTSRAFPPPECWPKSVHILQAIEFSGAPSGAGKITSKLPKGTEVKATLTDDHSTLFLRSMDLEASAPIGMTDFLEEAERIRVKIIESEKLTEQISREKLRQEKILADQEAEKNRKEMLLKNSRTISFRVLQVLADGCMVEPDGFDGRVYLEGLSGAAEGEHFSAHVIRSGTFSYKTVLGAPSTIEKWVMIAD